MPIPRGTRDGTPPPAPPNGAKLPISHLQPSCTSGGWVRLAMCVRRAVCWRCLEGGGGWSATETTTESAGAGRGGILQASPCRYPLENDSILGTN